jgi:death on curing protein
LQNRKRHYRVTFGDALDAHDVALKFGGLDGVRHEAEILSAIGRPYTGYYRSIYKKAAALFQSVARNHGFTDGNKRTAVVLTTLLIERSGYVLKAHGRESLERAFEALALRVVNDNPSMDDIEAWFRLRCRRA